MLVVSPDKVIEVPAGPEAVTASWLTEVFRSAGLIRGAVVRSFVMRPVGVEAGYAARLARFVLDYDKPSPGAPASIIGKFASADPQVHLFSQNSSAREIRFYEAMAPRQPLPVPHCYYSALDLETGACTLLLEDLAALRMPDLVAGCDEEDAERVVRLLAVVHARWWQHPALQKMAWLPCIDAYAACPFQAWWARYPQTVAALLPDYRLPDAFLAMGHRFSNAMAEVFAPLATPPLTCIHRDVHAENLFFGTTDDDPPLVLFDWQLVGRGRGVSDVTYFMISSMPPALRRQSERPLLRLYHRLLTEYGVRGYGFDQCWADYQRAFFGKLMVTVAATVLFDNESPRRRAWRKADLQRLVAFLENHRLEAFLG